MKELAARCTLCPQKANSACYFCTMDKPDPLTGELRPCRFVKVFEDGTGRQIRVLRRKDRELYKAFAHSSAGADWKPLNTKFLPWCASFDRAQMQLNFYAARKGWRAVWPVEEATV